MLNRSEQYDELATPRVGTPSRSYLGVPIVVGNSPIGVISVQSTREGGRFSEADSGLLATIAANVGVAIQNARLFEAQRAAEQQYRGLVEELPLVVYTDKPDASGATAGIPGVHQPASGTGLRLPPSTRGSRKASPNQCSCPRIGRALALVRSPTSKPVTNAGPRVPRSRGGRAGRLGPRRRLDRSRRAGHPDSSPGLHDRHHRAVEAAAELDRQKQYFESLVEISPVAIVVMDADEQVTGWNPAAAELFGYSPEEAIGRLIDDLVVGGDLREEGRDVTREALEAGRAHRITRRWRKDGTLVDVQMMFVPLRVDGEHVGFYAIYHDITELQRAREHAETLLAVTQVLGKTLSLEDTFETILGELQAGRAVRQLFHTGDSRNPPGDRERARLG